MRRIITFLMLMVAYIMGRGESDSNPLPGFIHYIGARAEGDYVPSSITDDLRVEASDAERITTHAAFVASLKYSFSLTNPKVRNYFPGGYQGLGIGLVNFTRAKRGDYSSSSHYIGMPVTLYVLQGAPVVKLSPSLSLAYEWQFGAAFGWKSYNSENRYFNLTVGSKVNAYLNASFLLRWNVSPRIMLEGGLSLSHFSNGNTSWPNPGINMVGVRVGVSCNVGTLAPSKFPTYIPDTIKGRRVDYDFYLWGSVRKRVYKGGERPILLNGRFACAGLSFEPMYKLNNWWKIGGALDLQWDESSNLDSNYASGSDPDNIRFYRPSFGSQISAGISVHGQLHMPIFTLDLGIGVNLLSPHENRGTYQNLTLRTYIGKTFFINIGYQLRNFAQQSNLLLGAGVTI